MSIEAGKELRVLFDVEPARIALDRFLYKFIARTHTRCPEMPVAQTDMPLRDGQAGLYPLFLMKSVHRIHPFLFCMVPVFQPVWCHGETAVHCRNPALFRCFGALNWYHTPILVSLRYHAQPALRADVSSRRRESGVFLSPAIFFDWPHGDPPSYSPGFRRSPASPHPGHSGPVKLFQGRGGHLSIPGLWRETPGKAAACDGCDDGDGILDAAPLQEISSFASLPSQLRRIVLLSRVRLSV